MAQKEVRLKLLVDKNSRRVVFDEADKNLIDFLFNLLSLPLGTVVRLLKKEKMPGCLSNLYDSVETLNETYMQPNQSKHTVLNPKVTFCGSAMLLPKIECSLKSCGSTNYYSGTSASEGGYVKGVVTYMVMDDLSVKPMSTISSITLLNEFNINEVGALQEKVVTLDVNKGVKLLEASLQSKTVLTDVFLRS